MTTEKKKLYNRNYYLNNAEKLKKYQQEYRNKKKNKIGEQNNKDRKMINESLILYFD
jgi:hypothetical protein